MLLGKLLLLLKVVFYLKKNKHLNLHKIALLKLFKVYFICYLKELNDANYYKKI